MNKPIIVIDLSAQVQTLPPALAAIIKRQAPAFEPTGKPCDCDACAAKRN